MQMELINKVVSDAIDVEIKTVKKTEKGIT